MARPAEKNPDRANRNRRRAAPDGSDLSAKITLTVTDVQRFLGKSKRAFYLLRRDPMEEFPTPFLIQGRDHWLMEDLLDWIEGRRRRDATPGRTALLSADRSLVLAAPDA
jgi:predicted DNA-binding transcriptional regulator AlpA